MIQIVQAESGSIPAVRSLWREYWDGLALPGTFQNFESELAGLPGAYASPSGCLLLGLWSGEPAGTAAFRFLNQRSCEAKRLYVRPRYRGQGMAAALLERLVEEARRAGYQEMYGDTLPSMQAALNLYARLGFVEVGPYSASPTPGAKFLRLTLV